MRILFDLMATQPKGEDKFDGGSKYAKIVFKHLVHHRNNAEIVCFYDKNRYFNEDILKIVKHGGLRLVDVKNKSAIQELVFTTKSDKIYSALPYQFYGLNFGNVEFIYTIHGLRPIEMPCDRYEIRYARSMRDVMKYFYKEIFRGRYLSMKKRQFKGIFQVSENIKIITPSLHTKYSLINNFPELRKKKIYVLYSPGESARRSSDDKKLQALGIEEKSFFLLVSANRWIKNSLRAIEALDQIFTSFPDLNKKVLVTGAGGNKRLRRVANKDRFVLQGYVGNSALETFYKSAYCLVYPTLNEGFGYPPLESMKYGTPVISSAITSITEICQDGVLYFNPFSIEELKDRILQMLFEPGAYKRYSQRGIEVSKSIGIKQDRMLDRLVEIILE